MSKLLYGILAAKLLFAPTLASAQDTADDRSGTITQGRFVPMSERPTAPSAQATGKAPRAARSARTTIDYKAQIRNLNERIESLESSGLDTSSYTDTLRSDLDRLQLELGENTANDQRLNTIIGVQIGRIDALVERVEQYERQSLDPTLEYVRGVFKTGLRELEADRQAVEIRCSEARESLLEVINLEQKYNTTSASLNERLRQLQDDPEVSDVDVIRRTREMRGELKDQEVKLTQKYQEQTQEFNACLDADEASIAHDKELRQRVIDNLFGKGRDARRAWFEAGLEGRFDSAAAVAGRGAICYRGDAVTACFGGGYGVGQQAISASTIQTGPTKEVAGEYTEESVAQETQETAVRYQWDAEARLSPRDLHVSPCWTLTPSGSVAVVSREQAVTTSAESTTQLYGAEGQAIGEAHTVTRDPSTEYRVSRALVPALNLDLTRQFTPNSPAGMFVRAGMGYDIQEKTLVGRLEIGSRF